MPVSNWNHARPYRAFVFNRGERLKLNLNKLLQSVWRTTYKIFVKALQRRLQPLLVEVIDSDQIAFFLLDSSTTTFFLRMSQFSGLRHHAKAQFSLKLDFDKIDWMFLFKVRDA